METIIATRIAIVFVTRGALACGSRRRRVNLLNLGTSMRVATNGRRWAVKEKINATHARRKSVRVGLRPWRLIEVRAWSRSGALWNSRETLGVAVARQTLRVAFIFSIGGCRFAFTVPRQRLGVADGARAVSQGETA